ncbi:MAG TPA: SusC/RagA family TonB-linked outer membrane protein [Gemmatimonadaceae bacterium]|nr:SusC/RagA family TonB-linked outer membrane protein [Gemmatimonadaceae bacterium]
MQLRRVLGFFALAFLATPALAVGQGTGIIRGRVSDAATGAPVVGVQVRVEGTTVGGQTGPDGTYTITGVPPGTRAVSTRRVGFAPARASITVPASGSATQDFALSMVVATLNEVVVTALGQTAAQRSIGTAQQSVRGAAIAETQRENFVNALQGRIAGVEVVSTSGVPGASSSITIRGVSSISSSNQPLFIIDGLPMDNKTLHTSVLASSFGGSGFSFENRGVDFTNRAADLNPEDIESLVVLKGPEAAVLYGIDAANGAIVITTKRGKAGVGGLDYNNSFRFESVRDRPEIQSVYGPSGTATGSLEYWGSPYPAGTQFFDNIDGFFQRGAAQKHNLTFSGAAQDARINYRLATSLTNQQGVVPNDKYDRINLTGASQAQVNEWLNADLSMNYTYADNNQSFKGANGVLVGLLVWPQTDDASDYLTPAGTRRRATALSLGGEIDNPYFSVDKNFNSSKNNRLIANVGLTIAPFSWGNLKTNIGTDTYTNQTEILRHPESIWGAGNNGIIDVANDMTRNTNVQTLFNVHSRPVTSAISISGLLGNQVSDYKSTVDAAVGRDFLEPNFVSVNNTNLRSSATRIAQRRLIGLFGRLTLDYKRYLYVTLDGRNDWTSTIPQERNSFFYPGVSTSFVFSDAFPAIGRFMTGKLRAAYAEVGKDARPYAFRPSLEFKTTSYGGYGYGFWGPNVNLRPEFARSYEFGTELSFLDNRLGIDATMYRKQTKDQIVDNIRGSYATGFVLFNLNGAVTRNEGLELTVRGTPILRDNLSWDLLANFDRSRGRVLELPHELPESYNSDTWLYGNIRNGTGPGLSTRSLTGRFYLRNDAGDLLISPTTGLPLRSTNFIDAGYDRQPDFTIGLSNTLRYKRASLSALVDIRKGGDVFNATEHFLTTRGLATRTLDREIPRVIEGVLRDGRENTDNPTRNTIVVTPAANTAFYEFMSEELFIEKDINWFRLRDVTLSYALPEGRFKRASVFMTATDLLLLTNYSGMDPIVNGNTAATGGSGAAGVDFGNFPMPRAFNFGLRMGF